jgi:hypothetical protein
MKAREARPATKSTDRLERYALAQARDRAAKALMASEGLDFFTAYQRVWDLETKKT